MELQPLFWNITALFVASLTAFPVETGNSIVVRVLYQDNESKYNCISINTNEVRSKVVYTVAKDVQVKS